MLGDVDDRQSRPPSSDDEELQLEACAASDDWRVGWSVLRLEYLSPAHVSDTEINYSGGEGCRLS